MPNVYVLCYGLNLLGVFETAAKAEQHVVLNLNRTADFRPNPVTSGLDHWVWGEFNITELPVR
jgi:hypothetical protein